ncbi:MAG: QueT transporter family protein, partial [Synergistaceae bacterium]|nr:QueT transporter family protein [Synergistaceae bacterium]
MKINSSHINKLARGALIAALYAALTILLAPISYGPVQCRVSEAFTLLPFYLPEAVPGLFIGCIFANFIGGYGLPDMVFGSLATLIAAFLTL